MQKTIEVLLESWLYPLAKRTQTEYRKEIKEFFEYVGGTGTDLRSLLESPLKVLHIG